MNVEKPMACIVLNLLMTDPSENKIAIIVPQLISKELKLNMNIAPVWVGKA